MDMPGGRRMEEIERNPFVFFGNCQYLQSRLESLTASDVEKLETANISLTGSKIQEYSIWGQRCTWIWASIIILPIFFIFCDWWKRCTYEAFEIKPAVYMSLSKVFGAPNIKNISLTVNDNTFDSNKAKIIYNLLAESRVKGFTFTNEAGDYDFNGRENSDFVKNMRPIKMINNIISDMRWGTEIVQ